MSDAEKSYGQEVYDALMAAGGYAYIAGPLNYRQIQKLKVADQETTLKLFFGKVFAIPQKFLSLDPQAFAKQIIRDSYEKASAIVAALPCVF